MTNEERIFHTNSLLERLPAYGEFDTIFDEENQIIDGSDFLSPKSGIMPAIEDLLKIRNLKYEAFLKEQEIIQELIFGGFIINRHDIKSEGKIYRQLTDSGRELKFLGSMESYNRAQQAKIDSNRDDADHKATERSRSKYLYYLTWSLAISTGVAALYYLRQLWISLCD